MYWVLHAGRGVTRVHAAFCFGGQPMSGGSGRAQRLPDAGLGPEALSGELNDEEDRRRLGRCVWRHNQTTEQCLFQQLRDGSLFHVLHCRFNKDERKKRYREAGQAEKRKALAAAGGGKFANKKRKKGGAGAE